MQTNQSRRVLRYADLEAAGYGSRTTIWRRVKEKKFPPPKNILGRPGWLDSTLREWEEDQPEVSPDLPPAA